MFRGKKPEISSKKFAWLRKFPLVIDEVRKIFLHENVKTFENSEDLGVLYHQLHFELRKNKHLIVL